MVADRKFAKVFFAEAKILIGMLDQANPDVRDRVAQMIDRSLELLNT